MSFVYAEITSPITSSEAQERHLITGKAPRGKTCAWEVQEVKGEISCPKKVDLHTEWLTISKGLRCISADVRGPPRTQLPFDA